MAFGGGPVGRGRGAILAALCAVIATVIASPWPLAALFGSVSVPVAAVLGFWLAPAALADRRRAFTTAAWFALLGSIVLVALTFAGLTLASLIGRPLNPSENPSAFVLLLVLFEFAYVPLVIVPALIVSTLWVLVMRALLGRDARTQP